jgi:hypothetical protein
MTGGVIMMRFWPIFVVFLFLGCSKESPKQKSVGFTAPEDGKIVMEQAKLYVNASRYLMGAISKHEKDMRGFASRYNISDDLSELSDSTYCDEHPDVVTAWERLQGRWKSYEMEAYQKAGIAEEEFNWTGGALADTVNAEIQSWVQEQLEELYKE